MYTTYQQPSQQMSAVFLNEHGVMVPYRNFTQTQIHQNMTNPVIKPIDEHIKNNFNLKNYINTDTYQNLVKHLKHEPKFSHYIYESKPKIISNPVITEIMQELWCGDIDNWNGSLILSELNPF